MSLDVYLVEMQEVDIFNQNITHNLNDMAQEAGIYYELWRPEEIGIMFAKDLIEPLEKGLALMESDPERFKKFNAKNGWAYTRILYRGLKIILKLVKIIRKQR